MNKSLKEFTGFEYTNPLPNTKTEVIFSLEDYVDEYVNSIRDELSDCGKDYLDNFISILTAEEDTNYVYSRAEMLCDELETDDNCDFQSKEALLGTIAIGASSYAYWTSHVSEWEELLSESEFPETKVGRGCSVTVYGYIINDDGWGWGGLPVYERTTTGDKWKQSTDDGRFSFDSFSSYSVVIKNVYDYQEKEIPCSKWVDYKGPTPTFHLTPVSHNWGKYALKAVAFGLVDAIGYGLCALGQGEGLLLLSSTVGTSGSTVLGWL